MFCPQADLFFADPHDAPVVPGNAGTLHLLRREAVLCLGLDPSTGQPIGHQALWPGAMATLAGVDLLAKFHAGEDEARGVGRRYKEFLDAYFGLADDDECEVLYQLRCSLLHSFGLYARSRSREYRFAVIALRKELIRVDGEDRYLVDLFSLYERFEHAIVKYIIALEQDIDLQAKFLRMFDNYGAVGIGSFGDA